MTKSLRSDSLSRMKQKALADPVVKKAFVEHSVVLEAARCVRTMRKNAGLTQEELAKRINVSQPVIARIEEGNGKRGITMNMLASLANACGQVVCIEAGSQKL